MTLTTEVDKWKRVRSLLSHEDVQELDRLLGIRERLVELTAKIETGRIQLAATEGESRAVVARLLREALEG